MLLIDYLSKNFFTKAQLLEVTGISETQLTAYQNKQVMPRASYKLKADIVCHSVFGEFKQTEEVEYYAKGYVAWIDMLETSPDAVQVSMDFNRRYKEAIEKLAAKGFTSKHEKVNGGIEAHIQEEWGYFLDGTYGLCTVSGLPEDIAAKELAALIIGEIIEGNHNAGLDANDKKRLSDAVDLLDRASSQFAPHEFERSSRNRLITQVRAKFFE